MTDESKRSSFFRAIRRFWGKTEEKKIPIEHRRHVRSYLEVPIFLEQPGSTVQATTFDISTEGLYVRTTTLPPVGAKFEARFVLPHGHEISCRMRVVWVNDFNAPSVVMNRPPGFGAEFEEISAADKTLIHEAIEKQLI